jgi:4-alpha-glucanotransferase
LRKLPSSHTNFGGIYEHFWPVLWTAFENFLQLGKSADEFANFCTDASQWLDDYALFMAIRSKFNGKQWTKWPPEFADVQSASAQLKICKELQQRVQFHKFCQWIFQKQWRKLKTFANENDVKIIGDMPIFVGFDSSDVWANRSAFKLDHHGLPSAVAGVPPDAFSPTGQLWGNPLYNWEALEADDFQWWRRRIGRYLELYDVIRIDHFRGFCDYWEIPANAAVATHGQWRKSVGLKFFHCLGEAFPGIKLIAEDLGILNENVIQLLEDTGLPGMSVLHFAFDGNNGNKYLPHEHNKNSVLYIGTHDNDTTRGWFSSLPNEIRHQLRCYLRTSCDDIAWDMIKKSYESPANMLILSMQDILNLGSEARFNTPSTAFGNWQWRATVAHFDRLRANGTDKYLANLGNIYGRLGNV